MITEKTEKGRIDAYCSVCKEGVQAPAKGLGVAVVEAWKTRHQHEGETDA